MCWSVTVLLEKVYAIQGRSQTFQNEGRQGGLRGEQGG